MGHSSPAPIITQQLIDTAECVSAIRRSLFPYLGVSVEVIVDYLPYIQGLVEKMLYGSLREGFDFHDAFFADRVPTEIAHRLDQELSMLIEGQFMLNGIDLTDTFVSWDRARDMYLIMRIHKRPAIRSDFDLLISELSDAYQTNNDIPRRVRAFLGMDKHG